ncbi:MAG: hypothetical protein CL916_08560 [Deltaproteobacteria bacterium]|nr:hypothetical protein [Deltaproteobacteria bacterium]
MKPDKEKKMKLYRWGQSAYETEEDLRKEQEGLCDIDCSLELGTTPPESADIQGLIVTSKVSVDSQIMSSLPNLTFVLTTTSGYEHIDLEYARNHDIVVGRCPIARRDAVIDTSIAMALSLVRNLPSLHHEAQKGVWARAQLPNRNIKRISNLSIGLIGYGIIGRAAFRVWSDLGAKVRWHDPNVLGSFPLEELLSMSDVVSLHCAHTPSSHNIVCTETLNMMPVGSILINTARGKCVDMEAVTQATHLGGFGLDVFPCEPPELLSSYAAHPNSILLPHAAGYHNELGSSVANEVIDSITMWMENNNLPHVV